MPEGNGAGFDSTTAIPQLTLDSDDKIIQTPGVIRWAKKHFLYLY